METRLHRYKKDKLQLSLLWRRVPEKTRLILVIHVVSLFLIVLSDLNYAAGVSLFAFLSAMTLWITTKLPAGFVAMTLIALIIFLKAAPAELLYQSFSEEVVWLMLGAFIIGEAVSQSGLADRLSTRLIRRAKGKKGISRSVSLLMGVSALFIPSTSGRAALSMSIVKQVSQNYSKQEKEALALSIPVIILMSTSATMIGAGSHLIGVGLLETTSGQSISFAQWLIWGLPFAAVISAISLFVIHRLFWPKDEEVETVNEVVRHPEKSELSDREKKTLAIIGALIIGWMTESVHGYDIAFITVIGALLLMMPQYGVITWKQGIQSISWNLLLFVAAATALGRVLVDTGVIYAIQQNISSVFHVLDGVPGWISVFVILLLSVTSHLYITSHTTRAIVFIPTLIVFGQAIGAELEAIVFLSLVGMNYCVTFPVSSKALLLFYEEGEISFDAKNLLKLSTILMPVYLIVMMVFYFTYWSWTGLSI